MALEELHLGHSRHELEKGTVSKANTSFVTLMVRDVCTIDAPTQVLLRLYVRIIKNSKRRNYVSSSTPAPFICEHALPNCQNCASLVVDDDCALRFSDVASTSSCRGPNEMRGDDADQSQWAAIFKKRRPVRGGVLAAFSKFYTCAKTLWFYTCTLRVFYTLTH